MTRASVSTLLLAALLVVLGCATAERPLLQSDYAASRTALGVGDYAAALERLPEGEAGSFITTMERTYLNLLQGRPDIDALARFRNLEDDRVRVHVTREVRTFFYMETPEGYYASEHEIVWMHLLLSWGYSLRGQREDACVEARKAGHLLTARWSEEGRFDDPTLRSILGVMWALCGAWQDAQVDFRVAAALDPRLGWAQALADRVTPPRNLFLVLGGVGPEPIWAPVVSENPVRGLRQVSFPSAARRSALFVDEGGKRLPLHLTPDATPWYVRHVQRDNAIQEGIGDTQYGLKGAGELGLYTTRTGAGMTYWAGVTTLGVISGAVFMYAVGSASVESQSPEGLVMAVTVGIIIPTAAYKHGKEVYEREEREGAERLKVEANPAFRYRFVRFLPDYAWIGWSDADLGATPTLAVERPDANAPAAVFGPVGSGWPRVFIAHVPDVPLQPRQEVTPRAAKQSRTPSLFSRPAHNPPAPGPQRRLSH